MTPASPVTCRLFVASDLPALYAIEEVCFAPPLRFSRGLMRSLAESPDCRTWMGIVMDVRVGFAIVGMRGNHEPTAAYIWTIEVPPAFRRRGVARQLLIHVEDSARTAGCVSIELHVDVSNSDAQALYLAREFTKFGVDAEFYGPGQDAFRLRKVL